ncbi:MAG: hypothetical protein AAGC92_07750 [Pseudomonadota bacterium]
MTGAMAWLLEVDRAEVERHANGHRTFDIPAEPIRVTMGYFTVFPDAQGRAVKPNEIYRQR